MNSGVFCISKDSTDTQHIEWIIAIWNDNEWIRPGISEQFHKIADRKYRRLGRAQGTIKTTQLCFQSKAAIDSTCKQRGLAVLRYLQTQPSVRFHSQGTVDPWIRR